jgi:methyl-accepting chemotaxis protein
MEAQIGEGAARLTFNTVDKIDRGLFERYGDVQAFANLEVARTGDAARISAIMNRMMQIYAPMYQLMVITDATGTIIAVNTVDPSGQPLDTAPLIGRDVRRAPWFTQAVAPSHKAGETVLSDLEEDPDVARLYQGHGRVLTFSYPIKDPDGRVVGVWMNRFDWRVVEQILQSVVTRAAEREQRHFAFTLVRQDGMVLDSPHDGDILHLSLTYRPMIQRLLTLTNGTNGTDTDAGIASPVRSVLGFVREPGYSVFPGFGWGLIMEEAETEAYASVYELRRHVLWFLFAMASVAVVIALIFSRSLVRPLKTAADLMEDICQNWDLTRRLSVGNRDEVGRLCESVNLFVGKLQTTLSQVAKTSGALATAAEELSVNATQLSKSGTEQVAKITAAADEVHKLSLTATKMATHAQGVTEKAQGAHRAAGQGHQVVVTTIDRIKILAEAINGSADRIQTLGQRSDQIGAIISVIRDIADQTNLLALNAAIEAARAGEQGRGFAVVADEVRKLAERTTKATHEIGNTIQSIQLDTAQAVEAMKTGTQNAASGQTMVQTAGNHLQEIVQAVRTVADMVQQIAQAIEEQSSSAQHIAENIGAAASLSQESDGDLAEVTAATSDLARIATELQSLLGGFKLS